MPSIVMVIGPVGSGKSTAAEDSAVLLSTHGRASTAISSGWLYRLFAYLAQGGKISWEDDQCTGLIATLTVMSIMVSPQRVINVDGYEIPVEHIKTEEISVLASKIAQYPAVRELCQDKLNEILATYDGEFVFIDGRDPDGDIYSLTVHKMVYLDVSDEVASKRTGETVEEVRARNQRDRVRLNRAKATAELYIDTNKLTPQEVATRIHATM
ncbi:hypothetical protein BH11PAT4_BH11PAT4_6620 [soil metagenome]